MILRVNPNRMELLRLRKRVVIAKRGHKLLRDKQEELLRWFMGLIRQWRTLREEVEMSLTTAFKELLNARAKATQEIIEIATAYPKGKLSLETRKKRILTIPVFEFSVTEVPNPVCYGFADTTSSLDKGLSLIKDILPKLTKLAELEYAIVRLSDEIERTRRRVNALEYVLIPALLDTIRYITMKLSEYERGNLTRLMRVKEIVRAR